MKTCIKVLKRALHLDYSYGKNLERFITRHYPQSIQDVERLEKEYYNLYRKENGIY